VSVRVCGVCGARGCVLGLPGSPSVYERAVSTGAQIEFLNDSPVLLGAFKKKKTTFVFVSFRANNFGCVA